MIVWDSKFVRSIFCLAVLGAIGMQASSCCAQSEPVPRRSYYQGFFDYYQGDYRDAGKIFQRAHKSALRFGQQRYLDSVCTLTMMGECYFQLGDYGQAIAHYEQALALYVSFVANDWQSRVKLPPLISQRNGAVQAAQIGWGRSKRRFVIPSLPDNFRVMFGEVGGVDRAFQQGGVARDAELKPVDVTEIMRCAAIALHRRRWIKGATCKYDPFSAQLLDGLAPYAGGNGTLLGAWNGVLLGIAQASVEKYDVAQAKLAASLQFNGGMDHPLTPIALLELADLQRIQGKNAEAGTLALEASYSGAIFNQYDVVAEAMMLGTQVHLIDNRSVYPPLEPVIAWSSRSRNESRLCQAVATIRLADCFAEMGETELCTKALAQARRTLGRADLSLTPEVGRAAYLSAVVQYINGDYARGQEELSNALTRFSNGSRWIYQLKLAESLVISGNVTERQADLLYSVLLRDPTAAEWESEPIEAMSFLMSNHLGAIERWFEIIVARKDFDRALQVSELLKRHRFFASLPMGGRLLSFRWMMESPAANLSQKTITHRAAMQGRFSAYQPLSARAAQLQQELMKLPLKPAEDSDDLKKQTDMFVELSQVSLAQESMLASVALRRQAAELSFPPMLSTSELSQRIRPGEVALVGVSTAATTYLFGVSQKGAALLGAFATRRVTNAVAKLNRELQILEKQIDFEDLAKHEKWHKAADDLTKSMLGSIPAEQWENVDRIVVVPDGVTWYLPWEVLRVGPDEQNLQMLSEKVQFRYSPTLGLAFGKKLPFHRVTRSAVFTSRLHSKSDEEQSKLAAEALLADLPTISIFEKRVMIPSNLLGTVADQFIVWSSIERARGGIPAVYQTTPIQLDSGRRPGSSLRGWMALPFRGVDRILIPGFVSDGGGGKGKTGGNDLFLMTTGLLASGVRTIGINRWSTSGKSTLDLSAEFIRQNKDKDATTAWSETIKAASKIDIDLKQEPRFKPTSKAPALTAQHPVFWSGMIIVEMPAEQPIDVDPDAVGPDDPDRDDGADDAPEDEDGQGKDDAAMDPEKAKADGGEVQGEGASAEEAESTKEGKSGDPDPTKESSKAGERGSEIDNPIKEKQGEGNGGR